MNSGLLYTILSISVTGAEAAPAAGGGGAGGQHLWQARQAGAWVRLWRNLESRFACFTSDGEIFELGLRVG